MGRSDPFVFDEYESMVSGLTDAKSVAFLGFSHENLVTRLFHNSQTRDFFDLALRNWDINDDWSLDKTYDMIVCTRCAYFARQPDVFVEKCRKHLSHGGHALIDWGLGDHWRFESYKVGWVRGGEHEYAYRPDNFLHSCFWNSELSSRPDVSDFWKAAARRGGYDSSKTLDEVVREEVPALVTYETERLTTRFLWPNDPQLYIITLLGAS